MARSLNIHAPLTAREAFASPGPVYFAHLIPEDGGFVVEFPDVPGCITEGDSLDEALYMAKDALSGWLWVALKHGDEIPKAVKRRGANYYPITPDADVAARLALLQTRKALALTQTQAAERLGMTQQAYRKLEMLGQPGGMRLSTITKLINAGLLGGVTFTPGAVPAQAPAKPAPRARKSTRSTKET